MPPARRAGVGHALEAMGQRGVIDSDTSRDNRSPDSAGRRQHPGRWHGRSAARLWKFRYPVVHHRSLRYPPLSESR